MHKPAIVILLILQSYVYAGPVCGHHSTMAESMDCCENGHNLVATDNPDLNNAHSESCCASCDMGKGLAIHQRQRISLSAHLDAQAVLPVESTIVAPPFLSVSGLVWRQQKFGFYSPPEIFLLNQSFLI